MQAQQCNNKSVIVLLSTQALIELLSGTVARSAHLQNPYKRPSGLHSVCGLVHNATMYVCRDTQNYRKGGGGGGGV